MKYKNNSSHQSVRTAVLVAGISAMLSACSPSSFFSSSAALTTIGLGSLGVAGGAILAEEDPSVDGTKASAALGAGAAALGLLAGAYMEEQHVAAQKEEFIRREPKPLDPIQAEIDHTNNLIHESTTWGKGEIRPWNERYLGESESRPYQGPSY